MKKFVSLVLVVVLALSLVTIASASTTNPISWKTNTVDISADDFNIVVDNKTFVPNSSISVSSDPGNHSYTTLETAWIQDGIEMRMNFYFTSDSQNHWIYEVRVYNGKNPADWIIWENTKLFESQLDKKVTAETFTISLNKDTLINFRNLKLNAFIETKKIDDESRIPPGTFTVSKYMLNSFIRTDYLEIATKDGNVVIYNCPNKYIIFQPKQEVQLNLRYGGYYMPSGSDLDQYLEHLKSIEINPIAIINLENLTDNLFMLRSFLFILTH